MENQMIYIYRSAASDGALELARALEGRKVRTVPTLRPNDTLVCWGEGGVRGARVLNGQAIHNKFADAQALAAAGVATVQVSRTRPTQAPVPEQVLDVQAGRLTQAQVRAMVGHLQDWLNQARPAVQAAIWLPRRMNHVGGHDLLHPPQTPEFWSKKEELVREFRIHCFRGKSIRAGVKVHREGHTPHPWIRSLDGGWRISYDGFNSPRPMRELAARACEALHLDFGAVDIGQKADGSLLVLEVNRAPGLDGNTITAYANAVRNWIAEPARA
jgi:hypothetical protein